MSSAPSSSSSSTKPEYKLYVCGKNDTFSLGSSVTSESILFPVIADLVPSDLRISQVAGGYETSALITDTGEVWMIGKNTCGQMGVGTCDPSKKYVRVPISTPVTQVCISKAASKKAGFLFSLFLLEDGTVMGSGSNECGQLGIGTARNQLTPVLIPGATDVIQIACGHFHSLFLKRDGTVWTCGATSFFHWGNFTSTVNELTKVQLGRDDVVKISAGGHHSVVVHADGTASAFGQNEFGNLANGIMRLRGGIDSVFKCQINNLVSATCGSAHTIFLKEGGVIMSCGCKKDDRLGFHPIGNSDVAHPGTVTDIPNDVVQIEAGNWHTLFLHRDGHVSGCGYNGLGQVGAEAKNQDRKPIKRISNVANCKYIAAGSQFSLFLCQ